jgi:mandelate racemase
MSAAVPACALRLRGVTCTPVEVPLRHMLGTSAATVRAAPLLLVDLHTEEGITGRSYVFAYRRSGAKAIALLLQDAVELTAGDVVAPLALAAKLQRRFALIGRRRPAISSCRTWRGSVA